MSPYLIVKIIIKWQNLIVYYTDIYWASTMLLETK